MYELSHRIDSLEYHSWENDNFIALAMLESLRLLIKFLLFSSNNLLRPKDEIIEKRFDALWER